MARQHEHDIHLFTEGSVRLWEREVEEEVDVTVIEASLLAKQQTAERCSSYIHTGVYLNLSSAFVSQVLGFQECTSMPGCTSLSLPTSFPAHLKLAILLPQLRLRLSATMPSSNLLNFTSNSSVRVILFLA